MISLSAVLNWRDLLPEGIVLFPQIFIQFERLKEKEIVVLKAL